MSQPKVSVIVPNYNHARFLALRIDSILNQTFQDFELILLDDHSTDGSEPLLRSYAGHPKVTHVLINDINSGSAFKQWRKGVDLAVGDWIWIAESDDYAELSFLEQMMGAVEPQKDVGLVYCDSFIVDDSGTTAAFTFKDIKNKDYQTDRWSRNFRNSGIDEIKKWFFPSGTINNTSAVLFRKKVFCDANPFDIDLSLVGDKYTFLKLLNAADVLYVHHTLNYYRLPFNAKYQDRLDDLFREQFLIFNWFVNQGIVTLKQSWYLFQPDLRFSLFSKWNKKKWKVIYSLFKVNVLLLLAAVVYNLFAPVTSRVAKFVSA